MQIMITHGSLAQTRVLQLSPVQVGALLVAGALALMATHPSLLKRPLAAWAHGALTVGLAALQAEHAIHQATPLLADPSWLGQVTDKLDVVCCGPGNTERSEALQRKS